MKTNKLLNEYKKLFNEDPIEYGNLNRKSKKYKEILLYCIDRNVKLDIDLLTKLCMDNAFVSYDCKGLYDREIDEDSKDCFVWIESFVGCPFCGIEFGQWVWNDDYKKIVDYIIFVIKDQLISRMNYYGDGDEKDYSQESISTICQILAKELDDTDVLIDVPSLIYELYKESNNYDSISKITFMLEKKLREINIDIRIYTFPSIKEARALLYAHEVELNEDDSYFDLFRKDIIA